MGVRELWTVLASVKEQLPISALAGKILAVDLSGWVCQASSIPSPKPHLRQVFVRVCRLCREGVELVVVLDGEAIQLKWGVMDTRARSAGAAGGRQRTTGHRNNLNRLVKECKELLALLGIPCLQSVGEAESLCALLNKERLVDGVLTQDGDAFLYGAPVVYKDLSITDLTVDCYRMSRVSTELGLTRTDLISLALLIGCDYCPAGVPGVGRAAALKFITSCKPCDSLDVMRGWAGVPESTECKVQSLHFEEACVLSTLTLRLSRGVSGFPSEAIIKEFVSHRDDLPAADQLSWQQPLVQGIQLFLKRQLEWPVENTCTKARLLLTQWIMRRKICGLKTTGRDGKECCIHPVCIVKDRREKKVACYEVCWNAAYRLVGNVEEVFNDLTNIEFTTIEKAQVFQRVYPIIHRDFEHAKLEKQKKSRKKGKLKDKNPMSLDGCSDRSDKKGLSTSDISASPSKNFESLSLIPPHQPLIHETVSCSLNATPPSTNPSLPIPPLSTAVLDSDSDDEPSLLERLQAYKHKQPPPKTSQLHKAQQDTCINPQDQILYKPISPVLLASSDEDDLPLFARLAISEAVSTTSTQSTTTKNNEGPLSPPKHHQMLLETNTGTQPYSGSKEQPILID